MELMTPMQDVVVIGGGPAGSSVANIVASHDCSVTILEKEFFPRYHIGESLIPFTYHALNRLGVVDKMKQSSFTKKYSVQFVAEDGTLHEPFYFSSRYDINTIAQTWQVDRAKFDKMLIDQAVANGASVVYGARVNELMYTKSGRVNGVRYTDTTTNTSQEVFAKWVVDATGRASLVGKNNKWMMKDPVLSNKMAIWTYFRGCKRAEGIDGGATIVAFIKDKGWFWFIPLEDGITSVGVVAEGSYLKRDQTKTISEMFWNEVKNNKWLENTLQNSERTADFSSTTDYSMQSKRSVAPGVVLVGDALAFLDPVFSSGVLLALKSGVMIGDILSKAIKDLNLDESCFLGYHETMQKSVENMRKLIHAFYNVNISFKDIMKQHPWAVNQITDCLSGDLETDYTELWKILI